MGIFGDSKAERIESLEKEVVKILGLIEELTQDFEKRTPEHEKDAKQASKKAAEFRNRAEERRQEVEEIHSATNSLLEEIIVLRDSISTIKDAATATNQSLNQALSEAEEVKNRLAADADAFDARVEKVDNVFDEHPHFEDDLTRLNDFLRDAGATLEKINQIQSNAANKKSDIDKLHQQILGFDDEDEDGEPIHIEGLKDELEGQFDKLSADLKNSSNQLKEIQKSAKSDYDTLIEEWRGNYESVYAEIDRLLPAAMTAGLSTAFFEKRVQEEEESKKLEKAFQYSVYGLIAISIVPATASLVFLGQGQEFEEVLLKMPRILLACLPIYIPVTWLAYSANKKLNLSKRLKEEYAHKEALSKTFEGLAKQIERVPDKDSSEKLRAKLLYDFLLASAENPGKLIQGYDKSDHPIMEAIEKTYKMEEAIDKIQRIPGLSGLTEVLEKTVQRTLEGKGQALDKALTKKSDKSPEETNT